MVRDTQASPQLLYIRFQEATQLHLYSWVLAHYKAVRTHVTVENRGGRDLRYKASIKVKPKPCDDNR